jgi:hypothetical protein
VHVCGKKNDHDDSHLICTTGLGLICDLLDFEINKEAEIYCKIFSLGSPTVIANLQFGRLIINQFFKWKNIYYASLAKEKEKK